MTTLEFTLAAEAVSQVSEALVCLAKFSESVSLEARSDKLTITALNLSKTAYAAFTLDAKTFFNSYTFRQAGLATSSDRFTCQLYNKCAFKARSGDPRARDNTIVRCDVILQDTPEKIESRLIVKMHYKHGMTKTHRLVYESVQIMHALFDSTAAAQGWSIRSRIMREYIEFFGPKTEQLDILAQDEKAIFTSFTEKITDGREVLKQPLETIITLHKDDFDDFHMLEGMHIVISVKDFKAIVVHAESFHSLLKASFSNPSRPFRLSYGGEGILCEFTLMSSGDRQTPSTATRFVSTRPEDQRSMPLDRTMPPPRVPDVNRENSFTSRSQAHRLQPSQSIPRAVEEDPESLFMPLDDDQTVWDPPNFDDPGHEEQLGYDASYRPEEPTQPGLRDFGSAPRMTRQISLLSGREDLGGLEPTQRLSQLHGMFD